MINITPTMFMGRPDELSSRPDIVPVDNVADAFSAVKRGHKVLVPPGRWEMVADLLRRFGAADEWIEYLLGRSRDFWTIEGNDS